MKHFGDITNIKGNEVPLVDIITGGSPCQDLSVAGKREGLSGARSGLFMEQIRIVKEMRDESIRQLRMRGADVDFRLIKPRFMVWENVPGAFSSNKGEDFRVVLEEICRIKDKDATIPMPKKGKWSTSGCIVGDGYSVAWRVHDAQFWGVPQRRKRIALVADFGGESASEILFERKGVSGNTEEGREEGQGVAGDTERSVDKTISFQERAGKPGGGKGILIQDERTGALSTLNNQSVCYGISSYDSNVMKSSNPHSGIYKANTTRTLDNNGGNPACNQGGMIVLEGNGSRPSHKGDGYKESDVSYTLNSTEQHAVCFEPGSMSRVGGHYYEDGKSGTLRANAGDNQQAVCTYQDKTGPLMASGYAKNGTQEVLNDMYVVSAETFHCTTEKNKVQTLKARDYKDPQVIAYSQDAYDKYSENDKSATIKQSGGVYGGGSEAIVVQSEHYAQEIAKE